MYLLFYITLVVLFLYGVLIKYYERSWKLLPDFAFDSVRVDFQPTITVVVPARNEADNIINCLETLAAQNYPPNLFEVIVVNDHSTDDTALLVSSFRMGNLRLLNLGDYLQGRQENSYKKKAIETAIRNASGELIVTTDADCVFHPDWLSTIAAFYIQQQAAFIAAPVKIDTSRTLLSIFQALDFLCLQGITAASVYNRFHNMCNGANLAYQKAVFHKVDGFQGIDHIASGDDMLLMQKIALSFPNKLYFLKSTSAIVNTGPARTWRAFLNQRIRWASKTGNYKDKKITSVLLLVYLLNLFLLAFFIAGFFKPVWFLIFIILVLTKTILEISFVRSVARFFSQQNLLWYFPLFQPLHILYIVIAGCLGVAGTYQWKERKVR